MNEKRDPTHVKAATDIERRARALFERAGAVADDEAVPEVARQNAESARFIAALAATSARGGERAVSAEALSVAAEIEKTSLVQMLAPAAKRGQPFIDGPKAPRLDALAKLILRALAELPDRATAQDVLAHVEAIDGGRVIQEIDCDDPDQPEIHWQHKGQEKKTTFKAFQNRIGEIRRKIRVGKIPTFD